MIGREGGRSRSYTCSVGKGRGSPRISPQFRSSPSCRGAPSNPPRLQRFGGGLERHENQSPAFRQSQPPPRRPLSVPWVARQTKLFHGLVQPRRKRHPTAVVIMVLVIREYSTQTHYYLNLRSRWPLLNSANSVR